MADTRTCEQCGTVFTPRREHARFCSASCRVAWNRENNIHDAAHASALQWSVTAMCDTTGRLPTVRPHERARGFAVISEAVWWVTIVDATLVRYYPDIYDALLDGQPRAERERIEATLGGLRYVRNRIGQEADHTDFICPPPGPCDGVSDWTWAAGAEPALGSLSPRGHDWEMTRYQAYQEQIAGHTVGEVFTRAAAFLKLAATACAPAEPGPAPDEVVTPAARLSGAPRSAGRRGLTRAAR